MDITGNIADVRRLRERSRLEHHSWGLVPTMGYLHEAHLSLVRRARAACDRVAVSLFVNPAQFNNPADYDSYPRDEARDLELLRAAGVDLAFTPDAGTLYPPGFQSYIEMGALADPLEGAARPGHFRGVATVVAKLFGIIEPHRAYFGEKDAQQVAVVQRMVQDLNIPVEIVPCPTVREADGLAMSSRNVRLTPEDRAAAPVLYRALAEAREAFQEGERDGEALRHRIRERIEAEPRARIDYVSVADPVTLEELDTIDPKGSALASLAVFFGDVRLIDNLRLVQEEVSVLAMDRGSASERSYRPQNSSKDVPS
jgi:pantoate--beta-alanine ligase